MVSKQTAVYRCEHKRRSRQLHDSTYYGSCRNRIIIYLFSHDTGVLLLALCWVLHLCTSFTAFLPSRLQAVLYLLHWLGLQKEQNRPPKWSRAPVQTTEPRTRITQTPKSPGHGAWLEHIREGHVRATVCSRDVVLDQVIPKSLQMELG